MTDIIFDIKLTPVPDSSEQLTKLEPLLNYFIADGLQFIDFNLTLKYNTETDSYSFLTLNGFPIIENISDNYEIDSANLKLKRLL